MQSAEAGVVFGCWKRPSSQDLAELKSHSAPSLSTPKVKIYGSRFLINKHKQSLDLYLHRVQKCQKENSNRLYRETLNWVCREAATHWVAWHYHFEIRMSTYSSLCGELMSSFPSQMNRRKVTVFGPVHGSKGVLCLLFCLLSKDLVGCSEVSFVRVPFNP